MDWKMTIGNKFVHIYFAVNLYREVGILRVIHPTDIVTVLSLTVYK